MIKNPTSKTCKATSFVSARYRLGLSGTPVMNSGFEMITILKFGLGLYYVDWTTIQRDPNGPYCRQLLASVSFGRKKSDIPELAHLIPQRDPIEVVILPWQAGLTKRLYIETRNSSLDKLAEIKTMRQELGEDRDDFQKRKIGITQHFWALFQKLRQICLHPFLIKWENSDIPYLAYSPDTSFLFPVWFQEKALETNLCLLRLGLNLTLRNTVISELAEKERDQIVPSPKMSYLWNLLKERNKIIAVSQFRSFLEQILGPWLERNGIGTMLFAGGSRSNQQYVLERFHTDPSIRVLLLQKTAGAHGLNLQQDSSTVVIFDPHFHDALDEQAASRVDRLGQLEERVVIRKLFMKGSVDEAMRIMQEKKRLNCEAWLGQANKTLTLESVALYLAESDSVGRDD